MQQDLPALTEWGYLVLDLMVDQLMHAWYERVRLDPTDHEF